MLRSGYRPGRWSSVVVFYVIQLLPLPAPWVQHRHCDSGADLRV